MSEVKQEVRQFYDRIGWQVVEGGDSQDPIYQNAHYEDLRPVSREYIHRCHLRVGRRLKPAGRFLLDAGSGPIQYPEYLGYSQGYTYRVCADISIVALQEARQRLSAQGSHCIPGSPCIHGLFVVCDVANLPFKPGVFEGAVSLHTIHHLPESEHLQAYQEIYRVLATGCSAAIVNGWPDSPFMDSFDPLIRFANRLRSLARRLSGRSSVSLVPGKPGKVKDRTLSKAGRAEAPQDEPKNGSVSQDRFVSQDRTLSKDRTVSKGTFTNRHDPAWIKNVVGAHMPVEISVWRSASVRFLRALIHSWLGGRWWLRLLYSLEERDPQYYGENGQYPLIVIRKDQTVSQDRFVSKVEQRIALHPTA